MDAKWTAALKGKRRKCSPFEMMFKKNLMAAKEMEKKKEKAVFKIGDFRKDLRKDDDTVLDIGAYR